jgi:rfaE bifunctional protein nucleotidyltransferase chain/domain
MRGVLELSEAIEKLTEFRSGRKIVFTNGCFDILHAGHIHYLQEAKSLGDHLIVGLNSDSSVKKLKGDERPIQNEKDRAIILSALECVDAVIVFSEETPKELIEALSPDVLVKGGDWKVEQIVGADTVLKNGGEVHSLSFVEGRSTTDLVKKIKKL